MDDQFDLITGLEEKNGYQSDSSIQDFKIAPGPPRWTRLPKRAMFFPDPGQSIYPLPVLITKMNSIIVVIGPLP